MGSQQHRFVRRMDPSIAAGLPFTEKPIIEIAGDRRVLVENHLGVREYGHEKITVQAVFGCICVTGTELEIIRMTKEQLVICGKIGCVQLLRREDPCV